MSVREIRQPECLTLLAAALLTRCWGLFTPGVVVWDEIHYERFAGAYLTGNTLPDVHPPLGKMLLAGAAWLLRIPGDSLLAAAPAPTLRLLPAIAGALIIPVVYLLMRALRASRPLATLAAGLLLVDNALLVESRFILTDGMLILFVLSALLCAVIAESRSGRSRLTYIVAAALFAGMAASIKWTGLSALGLILLAWVVNARIKRRPIPSLVTEGALLAAIPLAVYAASFALHFALVGHGGPYDGMPFARAFVAMNRDMQAINASWAGATNAGSSAWFTWPIAKHSMGFWTGGPERWIVMFGNPVVWWGALAGMALLGVAAALGRPALRAYRWPLMFLAAGYVLNFAPFAFITRPMYLYHYLVALIFSVMLASYGAGISFSQSGSRRLCWGVLILASATFAYLSPMSYGWPLSERAVLHRRWLLERHID